VNSDSTNSVLRSAGHPIARSTDAVRRGRRLEYLTLAWNSLEALASIIAGLLAGSIALIGFGLDSVIECFSGGVLLWRLRDGEAGEQREQLALRLVGLSFLALAAYVAYDAIAALVRHEAPEKSWFGVAVAIASLIAMPLLARAKRRVAGLVMVPLIAREGVEALRGKTCCQCSTCDK
jgi:divalent metal cation (Fe/Co/Zn/Cd) transporter